MALEKGSHSYGPYRDIPYCLSCGYFQIPDQALFGMTETCPNCGDPMRPTIGRYKIKKGSAGWGLFRKRTNEILGFEPRTERGGPR